MLHSLLQGKPGIVQTPLQKNPLINPKVPSLPDYGVGNFLEASGGTKKSGVFSGVTTTEPNEHTGFNTHFKDSV